MVEDYYILYNFLLVVRQEHAYMYTEYIWYVFSTYLHTDPGKINLHIRQFHDENFNRYEQM